MPQCKFIDTIINSDKVTRSIYVAHGPVDWVSDVTHWPLYQVSDVAKIFCSVEFFCRALEFYMFISQIYNTSQTSTEFDLFYSKSKIFLIFLL